MHRAHQADVDQLLAPPTLQGGGFTTCVCVCLQVRLVGAVVCLVGCFAGAGAGRQPAGRSSIQDCLLGLICSSRAQGLGLLAGSLVEVQQMSRPSMTEGISCCLTPLKLPGFQAEDAAAAQGCKYLLYRSPLCDAQLRHHHSDEQDCRCRGSADADDPVADQNRSQMGSSRLKPPVVKSKRRTFQDQLVERYRAVRGSGRELACMVTGAQLHYKKVKAAHIVGISDHAEYSWMLDELGMTLWDVRNGMLWAGWSASLKACFSEPITI